MISYKYRTFSLPRLLEIIDAKTAAEMGQAPLGSYLADDAETKAITDCLGAWGWRWVRTDGLIAIFEKQDSHFREAGDQLCGAVPPLLGNLLDHG